MSSNKVQSLNHAPFQSIPATFFSERWQNRDKLAKIPPDILKSRFGVFGTTLHRYANGVDDRAISPRGDASSISRETTFARDISDRAFLSDKLSYLAEKVGADLRQNGKQTRCITVKLRYSDFTTITRSHTLSQSTDTDQAIFQTGDDLMQKALTSERRAVRLIGIAVSNLVEPGKQLSMLNGTGQRQEKLNRAVDTQPLPSPSASASSIFSRPDRKGVPQSPPGRSGTSFPPLPGSTRSDTRPSRSDSRF